MKEISELQEFIINDFRQPILYLVPAMFFSVVGMAIYMVIYQIWNKKRYSSRKIVVCTLAFAYILVLIQTAFFSREPGSRKGISLTLFETWGNSNYMHAFFIENIIMFIPFGILMPVVVKRMQKVQNCVVTGFLFSCVIELSQLITQRGYCQLDDVVTNTVGALIGWLVWRGMSGMWKYVWFREK